jgi:hypothetical protein
MLRHEMAQAAVWWLYGINAYAHEFRQLQEHMEYFRKRTVKEIKKLRAD